MSDPSGNFTDPSTNLPSSSAASNFPVAPTAGPDPTPTATFNPLPTAPTFGSAPSSDSFDFNVGTGPQLRFRPYAPLPRRSLASRVAGNATSTASPPASQSPSGQPVGQVSSVPISQGFVTPFASSLPPPFGHTAEYDKLKEDCESMRWQLIEKDQIISTLKMMQTALEQEQKRAVEERDREAEALLKRTREELEERFTHEQEALTKRVHDEQTEHFAREKEALLNGVREDLEQRFAREQEALVKRVRDEQKARITREMEALERGLTEQTRMLSFELQKREDECAALMKKADGDKQQFGSERDDLTQRLKNMTSTLEELRHEKEVLIMERDDTVRRHLGEMTTLANEKRASEEEFAAQLASKAALEKHVAVLEATRETRSGRENELENENAKLQFRLAVTESDKEMAEQEAERLASQCERVQNDTLHLGQKLELLGIENATLIKTLEAEREAKEVEPWVWLEAVPVPKGVPWLWFVAFLLAVLLGFVLVLPALFWAMGWFEKLGAFGYGGPDFDSTFSRLVAITLIYSHEFLCI